jgi:hypothetical protein
MLRTVSNRYILLIMKQQTTRRTLGETVRLELFLQSKTLTALALSLNFHTSRLRRYLEDPSRFTANQLRVLSAFINVPLADLLDLVPSESDAA